MLVGSTSPLGASQAAVDEQVERAVELALGQDVLAGAEEPRLGVVEQQRPVLLAAVLEEAGERRRAGTWSAPGYWKKPVVSSHGSMRVIESSPWLATQIGAGAGGDADRLAADGDRRADDAARSSGPGG